jgi:hypothetical protein
MRYIGELFFYLLDMPREGGVVSHCLLDGPTSMDDGGVITTAEMESNGF